MNSDVTQQPSRTWYAMPATLQVVDKKVWFDESGARHGETPNMVINCNSEADMFLIAAAPDLLVALKAALSALDGARGNINPERGFADEVEGEIAAAMASCESVLAKAEPLLNYAAPSSF
jgi:hypothetical protein